MEKKQSDLCLEILRRLHKAGILDDLILIGSWCVYFYREYSSNVSYMDQTTMRNQSFRTKKDRKLELVFNRKRNFQGMA
ncbi:MAG: hypothetical protein Q7J72_07380 [Candidatus Omnitrophota bacterium]|nr:hypothetical protein [Candidatus Omnitrophota bacterium]